MKHLSERLAALLVASKMTVEALATAIDAPLAEVMPWLEGTSTPNTDNCSSLGLLFSCSGKWISTGDGLTPAVLESPPAPAETPAQVGLESDLGDSDLVIPYLDLNPHNSDSFSVKEPRFTGRLLSMPAEFAGWLHDKYSDSKSLAAFYAFDLSMSPSFGEGDTLIIDLAQTDLNKYGVYAYTTAEKSLFVQRFCKTGTGMLTRASDRDNGHQYQVGISEQAQMTVIGRVVTAVRLTML